MIKAPAFLFPTTAIIIDDDAIYAKLMSQKIQSPLNIETYDRWDFLIKQKDRDFIFSPAVKESHDDVSVNQLIHKSIKDRKNYLSQLVSVVVVDLLLGDTTGIELFYQLNSPLIYKVLISNFIDLPHREEIKHAQNSGLIHAVLEKGPRLAQELSNTLITGQLRFFSALSNRILHNNDSCSYLSDTLFASHFRSMAEKFNPQYIWPNKEFNTFSLENNEDMQKSTLFITSLEEVKTLLDSENALTAPAKTIEQLDSGNFVLAHESPMLLDGTEWPQYIRPAKKLQGSSLTYLYNTQQENNLWTL